MTTTQKTTNGNDADEHVREATKKIQRIIAELTPEERARALGAAAMLYGFDDEAVQLLTLAKKRRAEAQSVSNGKSA